MSFLPRARLGLALVATLPPALTGCGGGPTDPTRQTLEELRAAAEARDVAAFAARVSEGFRGTNNLNKADAVAALRRYFAAYESVSLTLHGVETEAHAGGTTVRLVAEFSGRGQQAFGLGALLPGDAVYRFRLELVEEGEILRVREASWEPTVGAETSPP